MKTKCTCTCAQILRKAEIANHVQIYMNLVTLFFKVSNSHSTHPSLYFSSDFMSFRLLTITFLILFSFLMARITHWKYIILVRTAARIAVGEIVF